MKTVGRYVEPFVGGGSVFLGLQPGRGTLGDLNRDLISFYEYLRDVPRELREEAERLDGAGTRIAYDKARDEFNSGATGLRRAALFLFLNRTGFNGIWRVNRMGTYTVPFGHRRLALIPVADWMACSNALKRAKLVCGDYRATLKRVARGALVYLDPPYLDTSGKELFSRYTLAGFSRSDHVALRDEVDRLTRDGALVLLTIRDDPFIRNLYDDYKVDVALVSSTVGARGSHKLVSDLLIRNFEV
jgi:DNA adenine methylase